jgi:DNA-binding transcriptional regulator LsrR (DeoR family)
MHVLLEDVYVQEALRLFDRVSLALVGIGAIEPSRLLNLSGNAFSYEEQEHLRSLGAVGDILLRFFSANGEPIDSSFNKRVISMRLEQLREVERAVGVAGGVRKFAAIQGALRGGWVNVLVTDRQTAQNLIE